MSSSSPPDEAPTSGGVRSSRFERRKDEIINAAGALFNRHGLRDATLAVIAHEIGLNLKSLRYYFERREDLVAASFMRSIDLHHELVRQALTQTGVQARVTRFVGSYFALHSRVRRGEQPEFVYFGDLRALSEPHATVVWGAYNGLFKAIRSLFRTPGRPWPGAALNAATHMLLSQMLWSVVWTNDYGPEDLPRVTGHFTDILFRGLAAKPVELSRFASPPAPPPAASDRLSPELFLRTATSLINQLGFRGASVDRISAELNVTKGAFYHYNETRDGLVVACFERSFDRIRAAQRDAIAGHADGLSQLCAATASLVTGQMLEHGTLLRTSALTAIAPHLLDAALRRHPERRHHRRHRPSIGCPDRGRDGQRRRQLGRGAEALGARRERGERLRPVSPATAVRHPAGAVARSRARF